MSSLKYESGKLKVDNYYHDPGEVNVHQFYPVLEHSFNKQLAISNKNVFHSTVEKFGAELKDGDFKSQVNQVHIPEDTHDDDDDDETEEEKREQTGEIRESKEMRELVDNNYTTEGNYSDRNNIQDGVFPTAVSEESIEAAKQRSKELFTAGDWRNGRQLRKGRPIKIVAKKAHEYFHQAMKEKEERNVMGVINYLNKAINLLSDDPVFYVERGEAYLCLCDFQSAILNYKKACLLATKNHDYHSRLAFLYYFQGQTLFDQRLFSEALVSFSRASKMNPGNVGYQTRCLACLAALQKHDQCLELVNRRLEDDKNNPDLYILRARLHEISANTSLCCQDVREALVLNPHHPEAESMMDDFVKRANSNKLQSMQLSIMGKYSEALQKISLAIQTHRNVADYYVLRGALHRKLKNFNSAVDDFLLVLDMCGHKEDDPVFKNSQRQLLLTFNDFAVECFNKGCYQDAIILLNKALKEETNEKSLYVNRGDCFLKQDDLNFALQDYEQAHELDPQDQAIKFRMSFVYNEFGVCMFEDRNYADAEAEFTLALQYSPQIGQYYISRSRARYMLKDMTGARDDFLQGLLLSPTDDEVMSISSRLFPGKSLADIISSTAARCAQMKLNNLITSDKVTQPVPSKVSTDDEGCRYSQQTETDSREGQGHATDCGEGQTMLQLGEVGKPAGSRMNFILCMEEREFYVKQVQIKKKADDRVKDALLNHQSLRYNGPHILALPRLSSKITGTTLKDHNQISDSYWRKGRINLQDSST